MQVELVYDHDCPNVEEARAELLRAFAQARVPVRWQEWERSAPESPSYARRYGSPTILIDSKDVVPMDEMGGAGCCRLYPGGTGARRSPSAEQIARRLREASFSTGETRRWTNALVVLPGVGVALLPKLACPACWPAYAALVSSMGLGFLIESRYLLGVTAGVLLFALSALFWRAESRRGYGPFALGVVATAAVLIGKFVMESQAVWWSGAVLLFAASAWNAWPRRAACPACAVPEQN
ncbi:MAG: MerC family mercury resistance protein [Terriglobales bacterium]